MFVDLPLDIIQVVVNTVGVDTAASDFATTIFQCPGRYGSFRAELSDAAVDRNASHDGNDFPNLAFVPIKVEQAHKLCFCWVTKLISAELYAVIQ